jgi:hypothetical protein
VQVVLALLPQQMVQMDQVLYLPL